MWTLILFWMNVFKECALLTFFLLKVVFESVVSRSARKQYARDFIRYFNKQKDKFRLKFVYGVFPAFIFYTNKYVPDNAAGVAYGNLVFIHPEFRDDEETLVHELAHVKQHYRYLFTFRSFRRAYGENPLPFEIEAARAEVEYRRRKEGEGSATKLALECVERLNREYGVIDTYKVYKLLTKPSLQEHIIILIRAVTRGLRTKLPLLFQVHLGTRNMQTNKQ